MIGHCSVCAREVFLVPARAFHGGYSDEKVVANHMAQNGGLSCPGVGKPPGQLLMVGAASQLPKDALDWNGRRKAAQIVNFGSAYGPPDNDERVGRERLRRALQMQQVVLVGGVRYPVRTTDDGVVRFLSGPQDHLFRAGALDLNKAVLAWRTGKLPMSLRAWGEWYMGLGYSVSGWAELSDFEALSIITPEWSHDGVTWSEAQAELDRSRAML